MPSRATAARTRGIQRTRNSLRDGTRRSGDVLRSICAPWRSPRSASAISGRSERMRQPPRRWDRPAGRRLTRQAPACCSVDYALGGGGSGERVAEGGVRIASPSKADGTAGAKRTDSRLDASAVGPHGAMDSQPSADQGRLHGVWSCGGACSGSPVSGISIPGIALSSASVEAMVVLDGSPIADIEHANPLPAHMAWARRELTSSAVNRRSRGIALQNTRRACLQKVPLTDG